MRTPTDVVVFTAGYCVNQIGGVDFTTVIEECSLPAALQDY